MSSKEPDESKTGSSPETCAISEIRTQTKQELLKALADRWTPLEKAGYTLTYHIAGRLLRLFYWFFGRWKIVGMENVPKTGAVLLASNHVSLLDPPMVGGALYGFRRVRFMAKIELWTTKIGYFVMDRIMSFPVNRGAADIATIRRTLDWLSKGDAIAIFPEGERSEDGKLRKGQPGVAMLVTRSGAPVVPVAILGTYAMLPKGAKGLKFGHVVVAFGKPIHFEPKTPREEILKRILDEIAGLMTANGQPTESPYSQD